MKPYEIITRTYDVNGFKIISNLELKLETTEEFSRFYSDELEFCLYHNRKEVSFKTKNSDSWESLEGTVSFEEEIESWDRKYTYKYNRDKKTFKIKYEKKKNPGPAPCCVCKP